MFCENCGTQVPPNSQFCNACGAAQRPVPPPPAYYPPQPSMQGQPGYLPPQPQQGVYTPAEGVYAQAQYNYAQPQMPVAGDRSGDAILARLPVVGGIAAAIGFFLLWETEFVMSGWAIFKYGLSMVSNPDTNNYAQQLAAMVMSILVVLIPIAAVFGLLSLTGARWTRSAAAVISVLALVDMIALYTFLVINRGLLLTELFSITGSGFYTVVFGLLWMIFTPLLAPKPKPVYVNPYMPG